MKVEYDPLYLNLCDEQKCPCCLGLIRKWSAKCQLGSWAQWVWAQRVLERRPQVKGVHQIRPFREFCLQILWQSRYWGAGNKKTPL